MQLLAYDDIEYFDEKVAQLDVSLMELKFWKTMSIMIRAVTKLVESLMHEKLCFNLWPQQSAFNINVQNPFNLF